MPSFATKTSGQPSPLKSATTTPSPAPLRSSLAGPVTSSNRALVIHVVGDDQIEPAVAVVVEEGRGHAPFRTLETRVLRDVFERPVVAVHEQAKTAVFRDHNIRPSVVVDVADGDPHAVAGD